MKPPFTLPLILVGRMLPAEETTPTDLANNTKIRVKLMPLVKFFSGSRKKFHAPRDVIGNIAALTRGKTLVLSRFKLGGLKNDGSNLAGSSIAL